MIGGYKIAAVCTARIYEEYVSSYLKEFNRVLAGNGWRVFVYTVHSDLFYKTRSDKGEKTVFDLIDTDRIEALVLFRNNLLDEELCESLLSRAEEKNIRIVMVDSFRKGCINMLFDYEEGFRSMVRHILDEHGCRDIRMIAGPKGVEASEARIRAVKELASERGIGFDESRLYYGDFWSDPTVKVCEKIIQQGSIPEALICANDTMAITACGVFRSHGYSIPGDLIITGFDGIEETNYTYPKISTVKCDFEKLAAASADALLDESIREKNIYILPDIIPSESCGCRKSTAMDVANVLTSYWDIFERYRNDERKLNIINAKVQLCSTLDEAEKELTNSVFYELVCVLKKECTDPTADPLCINTNTAFGTEMQILLDTREPYIGKERDMPITGIIPKLEEILEKKVPLIFIALHYIDIPLGYLCFCYADPKRMDYNKIGQSCGYFSSAVSGFRNMRYQNKLREWIEEVYKFDELTGLYTRKSFFKEYELLISGGGISDMTMVLCDLDGLKYINDNFGHSEGDNAIKVVAEALKKACPGGICSKHGGDELLAAVPGILDGSSIKDCVHKALSDYNAVSGKPYRVSASIGVSISKNGDISFEKLFAEADDLMYIDKMRKKNSRAAALI